MIEYVFVALIYMYTAFSGSGGPVVVGPFQTMNECNLAVEQIEKGIKSRNQIAKHNDFQSVIKMHHSCVEVIK